ncbi:MAG: glycoside hydrolase family 3 C-terminal domain-containing protein, partial [Chthoniobacteraceae bacterium]
MTTRSGGEIEMRIDSLIGQMTLEEKILLCHAGSKFEVPGIPRLGIPEFRMSDGPHGVRREISADSWDPVETDDDHSTYLPTGTAMAATWNPEVARIFGETLGAEARARGKDVILGPGINIIRSPLCGRNFEYYSEDPYLIAALVVPVIQGIQSQDVAACVKHYAANSQELNRHGVDAQMDERTLREIYLPGFHAAIVEGSCLTAMGAYNKFRGQFCCHNQYLVNDILKGEWKFEGSYISDWAGVEDTMEAACNGLDIEMGTNLPYDEYFLARPFREAIQRGELSEDLVNDKVRRNLRVMFRIGMFDAARKPGERNTAKHQRVALDIAREAVVLLKNDGGLLPLKKSELRRIVVIGDNAMAKHAFGGNSSAVKALYEVTPLEGLEKNVGGEVEVQYFRGYPRKISAFEPIKVEYLGTADEGSGTKGWKGAYYPNRDGQGGPVVRADGDVDFEWNGSGPFEGWLPEKFAVTWKTTVTPPESGIYEFVLEGANHASFVIDGHDFLQRWENGGENVLSKPVELEGGRVYQLGIILKPGGPDVRIRIAWIPPWMERKTEEPDELLAAVKNADAVLFFGGLNHQFDVEGFDRRDMTLPDGQNELIEQVVAANPRTAVILTGGSPMEMPWKDRVSAIVLMWYAGMEGGNAIADVLFGDVNPSGKLPMTFPKALQDSPAAALDDYAADVCHYKEGIFTGYRWFDAKGIEPLFPFGHGLSYTTFKLSGMKVTKTGGGVSVALDVTNTGGCAGAEVVQIYVSPRKSSVERPVRELKGFAKVMLQAGETKSVE